MLLCSFFLSQLLLLAILMKKILEGLLWRDFFASFTLFRRVRKMKIMDRFPTASEHLAASALLLLSSSFDDDVGTKSDQRVTALQTMLSSHSKSSSSTASTDASIDRPLLKVARRNRTKRYLVCKIQHNDDSTKAVTTASSASAPEGTVSDITSCLSAVSSEPPCHEEEITKLKKKAVTSGHLWRRAEAILTFLKSGGCASSEVRIRQVLGDTPDTSKALRILLKQEEIERSGGGGRSDPYIYKLK